MQNIITETITALSSFLLNSKQKIKEVPDGQSMISFICPLNIFRFENKIDSILKSYPRSFYFENPGENSLFLALDEALTISESGDGRFAATEKKLKLWRNKLITNQNDFDGMVFPLFVGGMKFTVEHSDDDWKDFNDSTWFLPEIVFLKKDNKQFLIFNSIVSSTSPDDKTIKKLRTKMESVFNCPEDAAKSIVIKSINGSTPKEKKKWKNIVQHSLDKIQDGLLQKVVISRRIEIVLSGEPSISYILGKLKNSNNSCYLFFYRNGKSTFFGASPELLLKVKNDTLISEALAGSVQRGKNETEDKEFESVLMHSEKNLYEHKLVVEHITNSLKNFTEENPEIEKLTVRKLNNIQHLFTVISLVKKPDSHIFGIIKSLYPTPAVCGVPKESALNIIEDMEAEQRGLYSGIIGWFNFNNSCELVVGIRSALNVGNRILAYAGAGIVGQSNPNEEYSETEVKLKSILSVFPENAKS